MAKLNIQQETFDNYVKENIEDLGKSSILALTLSGATHKSSLAWVIF